MKKKQRYMVVDDDATNNMICKFIIKQFDKEAEIQVFDNPEKALAFIKKEYNKTLEAIPTILFLDVNMPTLSGWEFLDAFRQFDESVKNKFTIFILSSSIEDFSEEAEKYSLIQGFLSKPLKITYLEDVMKQLQESELY